MTRYEQEYYSDVKKQTKLLERIALALEDLVKREDTNQPGQAGDGFDVDMRNRNNEFLDLKNLGDLSNEPELDSFEVIINRLKKLNKIEKQTDYDLRRHIIECFNRGLYVTKKEAIIAYVKKKGKAGARYTDVIRMAYELSYGVGSFKPTQNRGYYSCAFSPRYGGHLVQGGTDYLTQPFNKTYYSNEYVQSVGIGVIEDYLDGDVNP